MHLNMFAQTPPMPARTQNVPQLVLTKRITCQLGHFVLTKITPIASGDTKSIQTGVDQTQAIPARANIYLNLC
jgi:hypothetical protein